MPPNGAIPVAIVLNSFEHGGTEHQMTELMCRLDRGQFAVFAVCLADKGTLKDRVAEAGIPIAAFPIGGVTSPAATLNQVARLAWWCRRHRIQVLHACDMYANIVGLPAATIARVPVRLGSRRDISLPERSTRNRSLQTASYRLAHRVVANSCAARDCLVDEGVAPSAITVIPNGIDMRRFPAPLPRLKGRRVVMVANLRPGKGHEILLQAAAAVLRRFPDTQFTIAGDGPRRTELQRMAAMLGVDRAVTFLGHRTDVPGLLREHDVFAFPSFMEAAPNAVMEAMAAGLPVVATRVGGIPEVVQHEETGLLTEAGDAEGLAAALLRVLADDGLAGQVAAAGRRLVETRHSLERMTREFEGLYLSELATHAPAALASAASSAASPRHVAAR